MTSVFIGGSRMISHLSEEVTARLRNIVSRNLAVLIGDANGSDKAVQRFFSEAGYRHVCVYCSGPECRNNLGLWKTIHVGVQRRTKDRQFYQIKDAKMASDCDYGFMLWDGESSGTLNNVVSVISRRKRCLLYVAPSRKLLPIRSPADLESVTRTLPSEILADLDKKTGFRERLLDLNAGAQQELTELEVREDQQPIWSGF
jgi:hypothetical protein